MTTQKVKEHYSDDSRILNLEHTIHTINNTLIRFEKRFDQIDANLKDMDKKIETKSDNLDKKFEAKFDKIEAKFEKFQTSMETHHRWTLGFIGGVYLVLISALITAFVKFVH